MGFGVQGSGLRGLGCAGSGLSIPRRLAGRIAIRTTTRVTIPAVRRIIMRVAKEFSQKSYYKECP